MSGEQRSGWAPVRARLSATGWLLVAIAVAALPACGQEGAQGQNQPPAATVVPSFEQIGIIEGFYGTPWSHQDRLDVLRFMKRVGMNAYYYAPKDDPYHRRRWRDPYPPAAHRRLRELVDTAQAAGIAFYYSISPGLSMVYSDSGDWKALRAKMTSIRELGVRHFALMLDDVPATLTHPADRAAFPTLADAHAALVNRTYELLAAHDADLVVTPTTYTNAWGDRQYLRRLGDAVPRSIPFFWTGPDVASPTITAEDAREWAELIGRPPLIWDNYPVNDYARWRLFLGPLTGRSADLPAAAIGIVANPMNQAHASMLPLATVASYGRDPAAYRPETATREVGAQLYGAEVAAALAPFLELFGDYGWNMNVFEPLVAPGHPIDVAAITRDIDRLESSLRDLAGLPAPQPRSVGALIDELRPIVTATQSRLERLMTDSTYERHGNALAFRAPLDRVVAAPPLHAITVDGHLDDWEGEVWRRLHGSGGPDDLAEIAMAWDGNGLLLALRVRDDQLTPESGPRTGEGDHVAVIIDHDRDLGITHISREDPIILLPAPQRGHPPSATVVGLDFHGFMAKNIAARRNLRFSEFLVTSLGTSLEPRLQRLRDGLRYAARLTAVGYVAEIGVPIPQQDEVRMTVVVTDVRRGGWRYRSLPVRNFPGNPATFAEVVAP